MEKRCIILLGDLPVYVSSSESYNKIKDVITKANNHTAHKWDIGCQCFPMFSKTSTVEWHCEGCQSAHEFMNIFMNLKFGSPPDDIGIYQEMYHIFAYYDKNVKEYPLKKFKEIPECEYCTKNKNFCVFFDEPVSVFWMAGLRTCTVVPDRLLTDELRTAPEKCKTLDKALELRNKFIDLGGSQVVFPVRAKAITHVYRY